MLSLVIPAYNAERFLPLILEKIPKEIETIVVDDGSKDNTKKIAERFKVKIIKHDVNKGKGAAMKTGAKHAKGDIIIFMDADNQHDPSEINKLIKPIQENEAEFVVGVRNCREIPFLRRIYNTLVRLSFNIFVDKNIADPLSGFRAIKKDAFNKLNLNADGYEIDSAMIFEAVKKNINIKNIPIKVNYDSKSNVRLFQALKLFIFILKNCIR